MKAIVQPSYGTPEVLRLDDIDRPQPGDDEVQVEVRAASVGAWDWHYLRPSPQLMRLTGFGVRRPRHRVTGVDLAGVVTGVGSTVDAFQVGDEVYGAGFGAFAEYACIPARAVAEKPERLSFVQAAAVPTAGTTALTGLRDVGGMRPGHKVAIIGAAGGVGTFAVQIAKILGGEVTAVCSSGSVELVRSLGADHVVDYTTASLADTGERYDVILQLSGAQTASELRRSLTRDGTLVLSSGDGGDWVGPLPRLGRALLLSRFVSQSIKAFVADPTTELLRDLAGMIESDGLHPVIEATHPLADVAAAIAHLQYGHARGKTVITI